ncbi:WAT1-related protein At4g30420-like [Silene latifolia]|uniref:WAT1-related protein At4g30420-like n=1 Tax=Silene latifolia TaxID=37657 RepID=UPI003D7839E2
MTLIQTLLKIRGAKKIIMAYLGDHLPALAMVFLQFVTATNSLLNRASLLEGMSPMVFIVYRQTISALVMFPIYYFTRGKFVRSSMELRTFLLIFLIGAVLNQFLYYQGLYMTSSSIATATSNLVPAVTFLFAAVLRLEKVDVARLSSIAKITGTIFCVGGAVSITLLRGPKILNSEHSSQLTDLPDLQVSESSDQTWLLGCLILMASMCCWSAWLILQAEVTRCYPDPLSLSAWMSLMAAIQAAVIALFTERDPAAWNLTSPLELSSCFFSGIVGSGVTFFIQAWCISKKGPFFSSMFTPLATIITTVLACIFLHEQLYIGSLLGAVGVIIGLYIVLWGKAQEAQGNTDLKPVKNPTTCSVTEEQTRLLDNDLEHPLLIEDSTNKVVDAV